jgi:hypothetical protein
MRAQLEKRVGAKVITYERDGTILPGGMCACCGAGPNAQPDWQSDPSYIYKAAMCDSDGVYYAMLCEACLEDFRAANDRRPLTERDEIAREITRLLGDDVDGAQTTMDDFPL